MVSVVNIPYSKIYTSSDFDEMTQLCYTFLNKIQLVILSSRICCKYEENAWNTNVFINFLF